MADEEIQREGTCVRDVAAADFIKALAAHFKRSETINPPDNTAFIKTACHKESSPLDQDWFFIRAAAVARKIYLKPIGVGQLSRTFGGKARRGTRTNVFKKSCRGIIRQCIAQLKEADMVEPHRNGGWKITEEGQKALDTIAVAVRYPDEDDE